MPSIGILMSLAANDMEAQSRIAAFEQALAAVGWRDGANVRINIRWAGGDAARAHSYAKELVALRPDVLVAVSTINTSSLIEATRTIPIVFVAVSDPIGSRFVASWGHPGGNATGIANFWPSMSAKWIQMLKEIAPNVTRIGYLVNPETMIPPAYYMALRGSAQALGIGAVELYVRSAPEIEQALTKLAGHPNSGLIIFPDTFLLRNRALIIDLAARYRLPAVYPYGYFANEGGLFSYGVDVIGEYRQAAAYVSDILHGAKPGQLAVQHPERYELVINLRTAKALGLAVPRTLLATASELIQ